MHLSLPPPKLEAYILRLIKHHFPDGYRPAYTLSPHLARAVERTEHAFSHIRRKYYCEAGETVFDHLNGDHFATLLYFLGNTIWQDRGDTELPTRLFYLNRIMHGLDLFYSVAMPDIFLLVHPLGTVLGNATYGNYLVVYQNCTVGADADGCYPVFGEGTLLYAKSTVIGRCHVGDNVVLAANAFLLNTDVPSSTLVVGQYPTPRLLPNPVTVRERVFEPC